MLPAELLAAYAEDAPLRLIDQGAVHFRLEDIGWRKRDAYTPYCVLLNGAGYWYRTSSKWTPLGFIRLSLAQTH